jgi:D-sedoheptulose 7-phosphate isomerase
MTRNVQVYFKTLKSLLDGIAASEAGGHELETDNAFAKSIGIIIEQSNAGGKLLFIGNGASASMSSHIATDIWKNGGLKALAFNDSSLLTCVSNDYGYNSVFSKPIEMFAEEKDILVAISSSGKSENILNAVSAGKKKGLKVITLSGFEKDNPLRKLGDINFYVPASEYGYVEVVHHSILHFLVDSITEINNG